MNPRFEVVTPYEVVHGALAQIVAPNSVTSPTLTTPVGANQLANASVYVLTYGSGTLSGLESLESLSNLCTPHIIVYSDDILDAVPSYGVIGAYSRRAAADEEVPNYSNVQYYLPTPNVTALSFTSPKVPTVDGNLKKLEALRVNANDDWVSPTDYAFDRAVGVLRTLLEYPLTYITTDSEGGIRMAWHRFGKKVRVNIGARAELKTYIYYQSDDMYEVEDLSIANLQNRLRWLDA